MADVELLFTDCEVVTTDATFTGWVGVSEGRIESIGVNHPPRAQRVVNGKGRHLLPGRVEPHCHLRAASIDSELKEASHQAVAGGVTTLMPYMRAPQSYLDLVRDGPSPCRSTPCAMLRFHLQIQIPEHIAEIAACHERFGIRSFKVHIDSRRNPQFGLLPVDDGDLYLTMLAVRDFGGVVAVHCEDSEITRYLDQEIRSSGRTGLEAWQDVRPPIAEAADVNNVVYLAARLGCRVLIVHVSTADSSRPPSSTAIRAC